MKYLILQLLIAVFCLFQIQVKAQDLPPGICTIEKGELVFTIDLRWGKDIKQQLQKQYDLDSALVAGLYNGEREFEVNGEKWEAIHVDKYHVKLQKPVQEEASWGSFFFKLLLNDGQKGRPGYVNEPVYFGFNQFTVPSVIMLDSNQVRFTLAGFARAEQVFLAGSFNNWLTNDLPMRKTEKGWSVVIDLKPGKYYYKFIVDGHWIADPKNRMGEPDGVNAENSVLFITNHTFVLRGYPDAKNVFVAGSFNDWPPGSARMYKTDSGWELPVYLDYGRHTYKYVVDEKWIPDPGNPAVVPNEHGTYNSVINIGDRVIFELEGFPYAKNVYLAGTFNNWNERGIPMQRTDSVWVADYYFGPGNYEYKFIVDGSWIPDPDNPMRLGTGEFINSLFIYKPNHTFILDAFPDAKEVIVTGSFNGWMHHGYKMQQRNNRWELDLFLPGGKVTYKFIVDGKWMPDPNNPTYETNEHGTYNSVLWMD